MNDPDTHNTEASPEELARIQEIIAVFANRFVIIAGDTTTRITFGEAVSGTGASFRTAVVLSTSDAQWLGAALTQTIERHLALRNHAE